MGHGLGPELDNYGGPYSSLLLWTLVCHLPDDNHHHPDGNEPVGPDWGADGRSVEADHEQQVQHLQFIVKSSP